MRRPLVGVCLVSAIFTGVALVPGTIVLGLFLVVVPGLVLIASPYLFAVSLACLMAVALFGHLGLAARICAYAGFALLLLALATAAAWQINRPLMREWEKLSAGDHPWSGTKDGIGAIALLQDRHAAGGNPSLCFNLCQSLLYTGTAESVLQGASPGDSDSSITDAALPVIRYRVEKRDSCPPVTLPDWMIRQSDLNIFNERQLLADVKVRIAEGDCLIAETATLAQSDLVVVNEVLRNAHRPSMRDRWKPTLDTLSARRLTIYRIRDGRPVQLSRETSMTAYPVFTPLFIGLLTGDPIDIELGILRVPRKNPGDDIGAFFEKVFGLKAAPVGTTVTTRPLENMPRLLDKSANTSADQSLGEVERLLREALANPTLPPNSPNLILATTYFESIARNRSGDVPLLAGLISDRRVTDVSDALRRAVIALGPASAPLAGPLLNRIDAEIPGGQPKLVRQLSESFESLPSGAAIPVMPHLESLARDKQRRERAYRILPRLADQGAASLPHFLDFIQAGPSEHAPRGPREPDDLLLRAGISGLCRLGPVAASAAPILLAKLEAYRNAGNLGEIERAEVQALIRMGRQQELAQFFTRPGPVKFVTNQSPDAALASCRVF